MKTFTRMQICYCVQIWQYLLITNSIIYKLYFDILYNP